MTRTKPLVIAHRGFCAVAPENTMLAFLRAREVGADGIEIDVRLTKDREAVVLHDERLDRTTNGSGRVSDFTLAEIQRLDAGSWFGRQTGGERIPTFRQVCAFIADWGGLVNVELETMRFLYPGIEQLVIDLIYQFGISQQVILSSFNHESLKLCKELAPSIPTAPLYGSCIIYKPWIYAQSFGAEGLHPLYRIVSKEMVDNAHAAGIEVRPWTVNDPEDIRRLVKYGVDAIITDHPDRVLQELSVWGNGPG